MARLKTLRPKLAEQRPRLATVAPGSWRAGLTSSQRGYDYRWQKAREAYLLDHPLCVYCLRKGMTSAACVVDHIEAHHGNQELFWDRENWQSLCKPCHDSDKQREEAAARAGR
ncbi:HNH endonuclease [Pseudomonas nitroreducens]|uniref:Putative HNH nuclease YajD n=1 Tax=Pseudomonas nitroreducens TaxID=46680 RepID=A0A6G6J2K9_PSENT|nr:HNH endonuclease signature motif containing protein [Pseudomonas nitroreducens]QIE89467.1 HNH endonuclease [Pseudomonas nitroreducens]